MYSPDSTKSEFIRGFQHLLADQEAIVTDPAYLFLILQMKQQKRIEKKSTLVASAIFISELRDYLTLIKAQPTNCRHQLLIRDGHWLTLHVEKKYGKALYTTKFHKQGSQ